MFSFTTNPTIIITLDGDNTRPRKTMKVPGQDPLELPVYTGQENVSGVIDISVPAGKKVEHQGIRIEMIGQTGTLPILLKIAFFSNFC
jgi:vacuolar protein sorting-associated protein 26